MKLNVDLRVEDAREFPKEYIKGTIEVPDAPVIALLAMELSDKFSFPEAIKEVRSCHQHVKEAMDNES